MDSVDENVKKCSLLEEETTIKSYKKCAKKVADCFLYFYLKTCSILHGNNYK